MFQACQDMFVSAVYSSIELSRSTIAMSKNIPRSGVNFINILYTTFMIVDPKSIKKYS